MLYISGIYDKENNKSNTWAVGDDCARIIDGLKVLVITNHRIIDGEGICEVVLDRYSANLLIPFKYIKEL